jgi:CheY-like chemotaxis protein
MEPLPAEGGFHADFSILVVHDEKDFLGTTVNRLLKRSIDAVGAASGEEALALMRKRLFDVLVLDAKMPGGGMDGIEALRSIKKLQPLAEVILLTGHAPRGDKRSSSTSASRTSSPGHHPGCPERSPRALSPGSIIQTRRLPVPIIAFITSP